jgi:hypothetical protein
MIHNSFSTPHLLFIRKTVLASHSGICKKPSPLGEDVHMPKRQGKPQNAEQGISNLEGIPSSFCGSMFAIRYSIYSPSGPASRIYSTKPRQPAKLSALAGSS